MRRSAARESPSVQTTDDVTLIGRLRRLPGDQSGLPPSRPTGTNRSREKKEREMKGVL